MNRGVGAIVSILLTSACCLAEPSDTWNMKIEYFKNVNLTCSDNPEIALQFWILPSGNIIPPMGGNNDNHIQLTENSKQLQIHKLDDDDFGLYFCVFNFNGSTRLSKTGINIDGPYYGEDIINGYKRKAVIGGISAGVALGLIFIVGLLCTLCNKSQKSITDIEKNHDVGAINNVLTTTETVISNSSTDRSPTKIGDSIYDTADALLQEKVTNGSAQVTCNDGNRESFAGQYEESVVSESGHYQSIGSLERDMKPFFGHVAEDADNKTADKDGVSEARDSDKRSNSETSEATEEVFLMNRHDDSVISDETSLEGNVEEHISNGTIGADKESFVESHEHDEHPVYAKPMKNRQQARIDKIDVSIVQGEVIIESSGASVPVTTAQNVSQSYDASMISSTSANSWNTETKRNIVNPINAVTNQGDIETEAMPIKENDPSDNANVSVQVETDSMTQHHGTETETNPTRENETTGDPTVSDIGNTEHGNNAPDELKQKSLTEKIEIENPNNKCETGNASINNGTNGCDGSGELEEKQAKTPKTASRSSSCSETKSTVDEETIANFENVLASLNFTKKKGSTSSFGNVSGNSPDEDNTSGTQSVEDVRL